MTPRQTLADRADFLGVVLLAPAVAYIVLLVGVPFVLAIVLSFSNATAGSLTFGWAGLRNYAAILGDPIFLRALRNSAVVTIGSQVLVVILATGAAQVFRASFRGKRFARFVLLLPWAVPVSLAAIAWTWIFDSTFSVINWTLKAAGLLHGWLYWLGDPALALFAIIIVQAWRIFPFATVIMLAGLASIPQEIVEAAIVDGAGFWRRLFQVELPLLLPVVAVAVLFGVVYTATDLGVVYILTGGGPANTTHVLPTLAFQRGIQGSDLGQGAAIAVFLLPFLMVVAIAILRLARRSEVGGAGGRGGATMRRVALYAA
ncbi:MAG TPA: sugar ABC transporter permease, partial [Gemmatimonadales bacterium]|nr:sugar ABC transporter permease [Gemmatimonadales bacterium]